jgi:hypothetical protein
MRITGTRFGAASVLVVAGLLASCSAAHARPGAQSRAATRPAGTRAAHARAGAQAAAGSRLKVSRGPWWQQEPNPCGPAALVRAAGHVMGVGTCGGRLAIPGRKLTLAVGQRIDVHMLDAGLIRLPHSSRLAVLAPVAGSRHGATQTYRAAGPGHAVLVSGAAACFIFRHGEGLQATRDCPVVMVTVVPGLRRAPVLLP